MICATDRSDICQISEMPIPRLLGGLRRKSGICCPLLANIKFCILPAEGNSIEMAQMPGYGSCL